MEGKMPNCDSDVGPPLKKARYQWQVKGQKKLKGNDEQLKSFQEDVTITSDIKESSVSPEQIPTENVPIWSPNITEQKRLDENDSQVQSFQKQTTREGMKDHEVHPSSPVGSPLITLSYPVNDQSLPICSGDTSVARCVIKPRRTCLEPLQDGLKQNVCSSTGTVSSNENLCSCSSVTATCKSSSHSYVETPCSENSIDHLATRIESSDNSICTREDSIVKGNHGNSYGIPEPGTSSVDKHENISSPGENAPDILALESSNTNFIDLIQTKVDIQARKLNLLNMVQSNRQDDTSSKDNTSNITNPIKPLSLSNPQSPTTTACGLSTDIPASCTTFTLNHNLTDNATNNDHPVEVPQNSPPPDSSIANSPNPPDDETFLCRWQSQHTAKAIVDNAINKTLEEMGLTPDVSTSAWNRLFLEDEGISEAIRLRGLWLRENNIQSARIHPLITQITGASEQVFEQSMDNVIRTLRPNERQAVHSDAVSSNTVELDVLERACDGECSSDSEDHHESDYRGSASEQALAAADDVLQCALNAAITSKGGRPIKTNVALTSTEVTVEIPENITDRETDSNALHVDVQTVYLPGNENGPKNLNGDSLTQQNVSVTVHLPNENVTLSANENVTHTTNTNVTNTTNKNMRYHIDSKAIKQALELLQQWNKTNTRTSSDDIIILFKTIVDIIKQDNERIRRQAMFKMADLANENWEVNYTTHNPQLVNDSYPMHDFEVISEEEILRAKHLYIKKILIYVGITMASVLVFTVIGFFFITDPKSCVLAFATGSPCCLVLCPCIVKSLSQFLNPGQVVRDQMNTYLPGMLIDRSGNIELYEITPAEMEAIQVMINDVIDFIQ